MSMTPNYLRSLPALTLRRVWSVEVSFEAEGDKFTSHSLLFGSNLVISPKTSLLFH